MKQVCTNLLEQDPFRQMTPRMMKAVEMYTRQTLADASTLFPRTVKNIKNFAPLHCFLLKTTMNLTIENHDKFLWRLLLVPFSPNRIRALLLFRNTELHMIKMFTNLASSDGLVFLLQYFDT